jgi:hypothetical protein
MIDSFPQKIWPSTGETVDGLKPSGVLELYPDASTRKHWELLIESHSARSLVAVKQVRFQPGGQKYGTSIQCPAWISMDLLQMLQALAFKEVSVSKAGRLFPFSGEM